MIPQHVIYEKILPCLPVKSLTRFKCVCKEWSSSITSPEFTICHLERALSQNPKTIAPRLLVLLSCGFKSLDLENSFDDEKAAVIRHGGWPNGYHRILGSCHGLVCFCVENDLRYFFLLNPSTGESKRLAECKLLTDRWLSQCNYYGFGYDSSADDYKLMLHLHIDRKTIIFSLTKNSWRMIGEPWSVCNTLHSIGVYSNGALHWQFHYGGTGSILAFDLRMERFRLRPSPDASRSFHRQRLFGVGETLYFMKVVTNNSLDVLEFWYCFHGSWTKIFSFPAANGFTCFLNHLLSISKGNQLITENGEDILRFDAEGGLVERIRICNSSTPSRCVGYPRIASHSCDAIAYVETLVSPNAK